MMEAGLIFMGVYFGVFSMAVAFLVIRWIGARKRQGPSHPIERWRGQQHPHPVAHRSLEIRPGPSFYSLWDNSICPSNGPHKLP